MLVEPHQESRELLTSVLEYCGASVLATSSIEAAVERLQLITPHVVLNAICPPERNGRSLPAELRSLPGGDQIVAIAVTTTGDGRSLIADGFHAVVTKPVNPDLLCDAIRRLVWSER